MSATLIVRYQSPDHPLRWLLLGAGDARVELEGEDQTLPAPIAARAERSVLLLPAERCTVLSAEVPARGAEQLARAIGFAVEDQLIDPVEALHFAFDEPEHAGRQRVVALRRTELDAWLADLRARGVEPGSAFVDALALPWTEGITLELDGARARARFGVSKVWAGLGSELPEWLDLIALGATTRIAVSGVESAALALDPARFELREQANGAPTLHTLAFNAARRQAGPELLSGVYVPRQRGAAKRRLARLAAVFALAAAVFALSALAFEHFALSSRLAALKQAQAEIYAAAYPGASMTADPRARFEADLGQATPGATDDALGLLAQVAPLLAQSARQVLRGIDFRNQALEVVLLGDDLAALDAVREGIAATPGLRAELSQVNQTERGIEGRIVIRGGAP